MTSADLLPAAVLKRKAIVYVRQSTQTQVQINLDEIRRHVPPLRWCASVRDCYGADIIGMVRRVRSLGSVRLTGA